jgi:hypothetical protein
MGLDAGAQYVLVIHTFEWLTGERGRGSVDFGEEANEDRSS